MNDNLLLALVCFIAMGITALSGFWLIPFLRRLKYGQTILDIGPNWHKSKEGTPTMGGIMFILGITVAVVVGFPLSEGSGVGGYFDLQQVMNTRLIAGLLMSLGFMAIGFADDYVKVSKKQNLGLTARQKLVFQFVIAAGYLAALYMSGDTSTLVIIPVLGQLNLHIFYWPLAMLGIVYMVNSVNITDGLDGLLGSITLFAAMGFFAVALALGLIEMQMLSAAVIGGCIGFLIWNHYPAKVFMGDTGSMFLGGLICALTFGVGMPVLIIPIGFIYIVESLSVVLQVISFKTTGKRIFKMSPIHHHFEMLGYTENQIVMAFSVIAAVGSVLAAFYIFNYFG